MATSYTSLLGFALPVQGELSGTWGDVVNDSITQLVEDSVAGTATASVGSGDWTLTTTGSGVANEARCAILIPTGSPGVTRNIIAPGSSKAYIVDNQSDGAVVVKASATTGTTIAAGAKAVVAWNGSDFTTISTSTADGVTTISFGSTGLTPSTATSGAVTVSGTLAVGNGGTGATTLTGLVKGNGTSAFSAAVSGTDYAPATSGTSLLYGNGSGGFSNATVGSGISFTGGTLSATGSGGTVTSVDVSGGTTGLTTSGGPVTGSGTITLAGTLAVANGGTGATTLTGIVKGSGTSAFSAASAGTDYVAPATATTFTAKQTFTGDGNNAAIEVRNVIEDGTVSATAATGTINYDLFTQSVLYYTSNASGNWTVNIRADSNTTLSSIMDVGDSITFAFLVTQGATAYYASGFQVDGSSVTPKWQGGTAPTGGNTSSVDAYVYTVVKTAATPTYTVFASQTKFA